MKPQCRPCPPQRTPDQTIPGGPAPLPGGLGTGRGIGDEHPFGRKGGACHVDGTARRPVLPECEHAQTVVFWDTLNADVKGKRDITDIASLRGEGASGTCT